jgi:hypothetical protein
VAEPQVIANGPSVHVALARLVQVKSHSMAQQKLSTAHTSLQQRKSSQPVVACTVLHEPAAGLPQVQAGSPHKFVADCPHWKSQRTSQQYVSLAHTASQHTRSLQKGVLCS